MLQSDHARHEFSHETGVGIFLFQNASGLLVLLLNLSVPQQWPINIVQWVPLSGYRAPFFLIWGKTSCLEPEVS